MLMTFAAAKKFISRRIKYLLRNPTPPTTIAPFAGPVVVLGSAPTSHKPLGLDSTYRIISVNASQLALQSWGIDAPDITLMGYNEIEGTNKSAVETRRVLGGKRTGSLYVLAWRHGRERLQAGLEEFGYRCTEAHIIDRYQRIALLHQVSGQLNLELDADTKCSNGVIAVLFALYNGATAVILSGINPNSTGHVYNSANLERKHVRMDSEMLARLVRLGYPIYTADPQVAENVSLPLWQGNGQVKLG
ncbi:membrane-anchored protein [Rhizobium sp. CNPSo 3490]|uniref:membrane-anchored protein n=1 Tax=Rhizobium sp. CNPSo 3490 TaxID=3021407 RepID=UPI00254F06C7|nr:membrane-anchored protein [Rhizobium sp. CNPSo 3490]MDK4731557.1 membrane-anchored protein [Rhizobium sp. CNPSo 3490]